MSETVEEELARLKKESAEYKQYVDRCVASMLEVVNSAAEWRFDTYCEAERDNDSLGALCLGMNMMVSDTADAFAENRSALSKLEMFMESLPDPMFVVDDQLTITNMNTAAAELAGTASSEAVGQPCWEVFRSDRCGEGCTLRKSMKSGCSIRGEHATFQLSDGRTIDALISASSVKGKDNESLGGIEIIRDITDERRQAEALQEQVEIIRRQQLAIQELSTPVLQLWDGVLALPIIGIVDSRRTAEMMERLLDEIVARQSRYVILDITGVEIVDTMTADNFIKLMKAAELLGSQCILTGIRPAVAQTLVDLGLDLSSITTLSNLQAGLMECLRQTR